MSPDPQRLEADRRRQSPGGWNDQAEIIRRARPETGAKI